jgi:hypothetical protein
LAEHRQGLEVALLDFQKNGSGIRSQQESDQGKNLDRQVSDVSVAE